MTTIDTKSWLNFMWSLHNDVRQSIYDYSQNISFTKLNCVNTIYQEKAFVQ